MAAVNCDCVWISSCPRAASVAASRPPNAGETPALLMERREGKKDGRRQGILVADNRIVQLAAKITFQEGGRTPRRKVRPRASRWGRRARIQRRESGFPGVSAGFNPGKVTFPWFLPELTPGKLLSQSFR